MKRLRLSLGRIQEETLFLALAYAIDTFYEEGEDRESHKIAREFERLRDDLRRQRAIQRTRRQPEPATPFNLDGPADIVIDGAYGTPPIRNVGRNVTPKAIGGGS